MTKRASLLSNLLWTLLYACWTIDFHLLQTITRTIYTYRISLLKEKIAKIHNKLVTSVPSPVSVSPNKYASLVVEDVGTQYATDCTDTSASSVSRSTTVLSTGVPRSGLAPDVKRGVLDSRVLINGQKSPSLASSDSESPADDLEVGFPVELRQTITMECEVQIPVQVRGPVNTIEVKALLDSGATGCFVDKSWALDRCLRLSKLVKPVPVLNVNSTRNQEGDIMHYVLLTVGVGKHAEKLWCAVMCLGKVPLILGHNWLKKHNSDIDWMTGDVKLSRCPPKCKSLMDMRFAKLILDNESQEMWIQALKNHKSKGDVDESTLEEAQKLVPRTYWEYLDVLSKTKSERMPLRKPWDHGIDLKEDFPLKKGQLIPLSVDEQKEVEAFLDDQLYKGYIRPSNSQQTSPVFFVPKKDRKKRMVQDY